VLKQLFHDQNQKEVVLMITIIARLKAKPGKESLLYEECRKIAKLVRDQEPGCVMYVPHASKNNPAEIVFVEKYADKTALDNHLQTPYYMALRAQYGDLIVGAPEVEMLKELE
jgi:quinol monooxygenase YgiN